MIRSQLLAATALTSTVGFLVPGVALAAQVQDWSGFYAGVGLGVAASNSQIDFSDAPEGNPRPFDVQVGRFYRPIKQLVSLRVDADVLAWFLGQGKKYQTRMNEVLRREMQTNARSR